MKQIRNKWALLLNYIISDSVYCLLYLPKKNYFISGSDQRFISVISLLEEKCIKQLTGPSHSVISLVSLDDEFVASGNMDGTIKIWWIKSNIQSIYTLKIDGQRIMASQLNLLNNEYLVTKTGR